MWIHLLGLLDRASVTGEVTYAGYISIAHGVGLLFLLHLKLEQDLFFEMCRTFFKIIRMVGE
jgi:hypothetical protein